MASARRHPVVKTCLGTLMLREDKDKPGKSSEAKGSNETGAAAEMAVVASVT